MIYIDSNIFIIIKDGKTKAATSVLTIDEVFWEIKKHKGRGTAIEIVEALLGMPNAKAQSLKGKSTIDFTR